MFLIRYYKRIDCRSFSNSLPLEKRPKGDIDAPYTVCMICKIAGFASELKAVPIGFLCMSTNWTGLTRMSRINELNTDALCSSFVADVKLALSKRPAIIPRSLLVMSRVFALTNPCQIFHHNASGPNRFSKSHQLLTCSMDKLLCYGLLTSTQSLQATMSRASANTGKFCFGLSKTETAMVKNTSRDVQSFVGFLVGSGQDVLDATINANDGSCCFDFRNVYFNSQAEIPLPTRILQITGFGSRKPPPPKAASEASACHGG